MFRQAERAVCVFKLLHYRISPHSTTGVSSAQLLMNRQLHTQLNLLRPNLRDRVLEKQTRQKLTHDYHAKHREIQVDDSVNVKDFRRPKSWISGTAVERTGPVSAKVRLSTGESYEDTTTRTESVTIQFQRQKQIREIRISLLRRHPCLRVMCYRRQQYRLLYYCHLHHLYRYN